MTAEWEPATKRQLVRGIPAERYRVIMRILAPPSLVGLAGYGVARFATGSGWHSNPASWAFLGVFILLGAPAQVAAYLMVTRSKQENLAGYSTFASTGRSDLDLDEVDWKSGYVIRAAGDPQLTKAERAERVRLSRLPADED